MRNVTDDIEINKRRLLKMLAKSENVYQNLIKLAECENRMIRLEFWHVIRSLLQSMGVLQF